MSSARSIDLAEFIQNESAAILQKWQARVRRASGASRGQSSATLIDHLPELLQTIARTASSASGSGPIPPELTTLHATMRIEQGYCLAEVVLEYIELRSCIFERLEELGLVIEPRQSRQLHRVIDQALRETATRFVTSHEKMLRAMDQIAGKRTARRSLDDVLSDILHALADAAGAEVDSVAILLLEDDGRLHVRAAIGGEAEGDVDFSVAVGEGFSGRIADTSEPFLLRDAANDPLYMNPTIRRSGTRALYGVPLIDDGRTIGVAHMGSCTAFEFSEEDMMLFRAMCERATTAIIRARFVDTLERTSAFREQFIAVLGHDLRSPLNAILGTAEMLLRYEDVPPRVVASHQRIARSAMRMERLIAQLLDFTRARLGGGFALNRRPTALLDVVREVVDETSPTLGTRELRVEGDDVSGEWDRDRIAQALANLVTNAVKHSPDGARIRVRVTRDGASIAVVDVWNEGPPIPPGTKLFEPFARGTQAGEGLGLGLYITHEIVRAHGGSLSVRSDETGTTFTVRLPTLAGLADVPRSGPRAP